MKWQPISQYDQANDENNANDIPIAKQERECELITVSAIAADETDTIANNETKNNICLPFCLKFGFAVVILIVIGAIALSQQISSTEIMLFGDSLVGKTEDMYHIAEYMELELQQDHPNHGKIEVTTSGYGGNRIWDLRKRLDRDVLKRTPWWKWLSGTHLPPPNALIMYWDSDASDVEIIDDTTSVRQNFMINLIYVLQQLTMSIPYVIVAGPTLLGEYPHGQNAKDAMYDNYTSMVRNCTQRFGLPYIETRRLFFDNLPAGWHQRSGYLTLDGEHHNYQGTILIREAFLSAINQLDGFWST